MQVDLSRLHLLVSQPQGEVLFPSARGTRLTIHGVQYLLNKHRGTASKVCPSLKDKRVTVHRLRHTMAMDLGAAYAATPSYRLIYAKPGPVAGVTISPLVTGHQRGVLVAMRF